MDGTDTIDWSLQARALAHVDIASEALTGATPNLQKAVNHLATAHGLLVQMQGASASPVGGSNLMLIAALVAGVYFLTKK